MFPFCHAQSGDVSILQVQAGEVAIGVCFVDTCIGKFHVSALGPSIVALSSFLSSSLVSSQMTDIAHV